MHIDITIMIKRNVLLSTISLAEKVKSCYYLRHNSPRFKFHVGKFKSGVNQLDIEGSYYGYKME